MRGQGGNVVIWGRDDIYDEVYAVGGCRALRCDDGEVVVELVESVQGVGSGAGGRLLQQNLQFTAPDGVMQSLWAGALKSGACREAGSGASANRR